MREIDMPGKYDASAVEAGRYDKWVQENRFKPSGNDKARPYSIVIPPPNVTGKLHLGHAWDTTLQDMIIRQKRMQGFDTLWLPGMDHAGIATQAKVEQRLAEQGISRYDLGREKFVDQVWDWKNEYAATIKSQWGKMGLSLDYSRERFTLDEGLSEAVRKVFVTLYEKGLIYRGEYIINWDPKARTALSDIEVIHQDDEGAFYHVSLTMVRTTLKLQRRVLKRCLVTLLLLFTHQTNATRIWLVRWFAYHLLVARFQLSPTNTLTQSLVQEWLRLRQPTTLTTLVLVTATTWSVSTQ